jgi:hypothetical protein
MAIFTQIPVTLAFTLLSSVEGPLLSYVSLVSRQIYQAFHTFSRAVKSAASSVALHPFPGYARLVLLFSDSEWLEPAGFVQ